uniref:Vesicle-associated protein 1-2 n=1 Tax=Rhizophora mucronata TaxID=61149 RepID=A0A2P2IML7_RHIMU
MLRSSPVLISKPFRRIEQYNTKTNNKSGRFPTSRFGEDPKDTENCLESETFFLSQKSK